MTEVEHTEQLSTPTLGIIFAYFYDMVYLMQFSTCYHALYDHFLRDRLKPGWGYRGGGGACRITLFVLEDMLSELMRLGPLFVGLVCRGELSGASLC